MDNKEICEMVAIAARYGWEIKFLIDGDYFVATATNKINGGTIKSRTGYTSDGCVGAISCLFDQLAPMLADTKSMSLIELATIALSNNPGLGTKLDISCHNCNDDTVEVRIPSLKILTGGDNFFEAEEVAKEMIIEKYLKDCK